MFEKCALVAANMVGTAVAFRFIDPVLDWFEALMGIVQ